MNEFRCVRYEVLEFAIDGVDGKYGVLANIRMPMLETGPAEGDERLEEF